MVLTASRWSLLLLALCAMIAVAYLPPADIAESARWAPYAWPVNRVTSRMRLALAAERWMALSELEALRRSPPRGDVPVLVARGGLRPEVGQAVELLVRTIWRRAPRADSAIRLRVVASAYPTAYTEALDLWTAAQAPEVLLPQQTDGHTCLVIIPGILQQGVQTGYPQGWWRNNLRRQVGQAVAPCVLRAALGEPGPEVGRWMASRGYDLATSIGWAVGGNAGVEYADPWFNRFDWSQAAMPELLARIIGALPAAYEYSVAAAGCAGGRQARCGELVLRRSKDHPTSGPIRIIPGYGVRYGGLGGYNGAFISDLIQERGLGNFRRFWTSALPVEAAFSQVYGVSVDDWTRGWVRRQVGRVDLGAPIHPFGTFAGLLAGLIVVAVTAWAAVSREITQGAG